MIESVAPALEKKDADALKHVRDALRRAEEGLARRDAAEDAGEGLRRRCSSDVSRIELAAGKLM